MERNGQKMQNTSTHAPWRTYIHAPWRLSWILDPKSHLQHFMMDRQSCTMKDIHLCTLTPVMYPGSKIPSLARHDGQTIMHHAAHTRIFRVSVMFQPYFLDALPVISYIFCHFLSGNLPTNSLVMNFKRHPSIVALNLL